MSKLLLPGCQLPQLLHLPGELALLILIMRPWALVPNVIPSNDGTLVIVNGCVPETLNVP